MATPFTIPEGFPELLQDFTVSVLREKPSDIVEYAIVYFTDVATKRNPDRISTSAPAVIPSNHSIESKPEVNGTVKPVVEEAPVKESSVKFADAPVQNGSDAEEEPEDKPEALFDPSKISAPVGSDDDSDDDDAEISTSLTNIKASDFQPPSSFSRGRRCSVSAEPLSMEDDITNDRVIHPKTDEQRARLQEAVKGILLFRSLDQEQREYVLDAMFEKRVPEGERVIEWGDSGDYFYIVDSGRLDVLIKIDGEEKKVSTYDNTGSFGELALMYDTPRAATIVATEECILWALDRTTFRQLVMLTTMKKRQLYEEFLGQIKILESLEFYERMNLADALITKTYEAGSVVIKQGDEADAFYIVEKGTCVVKVKDTAEGAVDENTAQEVEVSRIERGGFFGELALIHKKPRAASVLAETDITLAVLDVDAFERLLGPCVDIMSRNVANYELQLAELFGDVSIDDLRR